MADSRVVDTNVLIVASAADDGSPFSPEATPVQEAELRRKVLDWLIDFENDAGKHVVLDWDWLICGEYLNPNSPKKEKLSEQDYGWLAMMAKKDRNEVVWVGLSKDADGHAILPTSLAHAITDKADRKMAAAVLAAQTDHHICALVNACDTDWLDCADALKQHDIRVEHVLEDWLTHKWQNKNAA